MDCVVFNKQFDLIYLRVVNCMTLCVQTLFIILTNMFVFLDLERVLNCN